MQPGPKACVLPVPPALAVPGCLWCLELVTVPPTRSYFQFYNTHDGNGLSLTTLYRTLTVDMTSIVLRLFRSYLLAL